MKRKRLGKFPSRFSYFIVLSENSRCLRPGGIPAGMETSPVSTIDKALRPGPGHGLPGVGADLSRVGIAQQIGLAGHISPLIDCIAVQNGGNLLPRDGSIGLEGPVPKTVDQSVGGSPGHRIGVILPICHIREIGGGNGRFPL